jgi:hypothetical protein
VHRGGRGAAAGITLTLVLALALAGVPPEQWIREKYVFQKYYDGAAQVRAVQAAALNRSEQPGPGTEPL